MTQYLHRIEGDMRVRILASVTLALTLAAGATLVAIPASASRSQAPTSFEEPDPVRVAELIGQGFSEGEALFIALTTVEGKAIGDDRVRIVNTFPTGNQAVITIRVVPKSTGNPDALKVKTGNAGKDFKFSLEYFVPFGAIPADARPTVALGAPSAGSVSLASLEVSAQGGGDPNGVQVLVQGLVDQFRGDKVDQFVEFLDTKLKTPKLDKLNNKLKAALVAKEVLDMGVELDKLLAEIDALEKCAKNPKNPLTKKAYKENPGERDRILKQIESTRAEIKGNTAANIIGALNSAGSGLIKAAPWLGYVIGPGTAWAKETMDKINKELVDDLKKAITSCELDLKIDGVVGTPAANITALKCGGPVGAWDVAYTQPAAQAEGHITFTLAEGSLTGAYEASGRAAGGRVASHFSGTATYAGAPDGTSGTLTLSVLGSVPVTGGKFCKNGQPPAG